MHDLITALALLFVGCMILAWIEMIGHAVERKRRLRAMRELRSGEQMSGCTYEKPAKRSQPVVRASVQPKRERSDDSLLRANGQHVKHQHFAVLRDGYTTMGDPLMVCVSQYSDESEAVAVCHATATVFGRSWLEHWSGSNGRPRQVVLIGYVRRGGAVVKDRNAGPTVAQLK